MQTGWVPPGPAPIAGTFLRRSRAAIHPASRPRKPRDSCRSHRIAAMFSCRAAWQRCGPLARGAARRLPRDVVQRRPMSSVPGGSGENVVYALLCGGAFVGAVSYAYNTVSTDSSRFNERMAEINARPKTEWTPKPWPPKSRDDAEDGEAEAVAEEASGEAEAVAEEASGEAEAVAEEASGEAEAVVEKVAEAVASVAEVVEVVAEATAEIAEVIAEDKVEKVAEEVAEVAEVIEEAAKAIAEPPAAEEPKSNGTTCSLEEEAAASEA